MAIELVLSVPEPSTNLMLLATRLLPEHFYAAKFKEFLCSSSKEIWSNIPQFVDFLRSFVVSSQTI